MQRPHIIERYLVSLGDQESQGLALSELEWDFLKVCRYTVDRESLIRELQGKLADTLDELAGTVGRDLSPRLAPSKTMKGKRGKR